MGEQGSNHTSMKRNQAHRGSRLSRLHLESPYPAIREAWQRGLDALKPTAAQLERGLELHASIGAIDTFGFLPMVYHEGMMGELMEMRKIGAGWSDFSFEYSMLRRRAGLSFSEGLEEFAFALVASGLGGVVLTCAEGKTRREDVKLIACQQAIIRKGARHLGVAGGVDDYEALRSEGRMAVFSSVNGPPVPGVSRNPLEEFSMLSAWHDLGVRLMHLTYNRRNTIGDGCGESTNAGLSEIGEALVGEMNRLGIVVDVAHSADKTCLDACRVSKRPVVATHSGRRAFHDHPRNKSDRTLKAIADSGGLVGVVSLPGILGHGGGLNVFLDAVADMVGFLGSEHVALATDYCYRSPGPDEFLHGSLPGVAVPPSWWGGTRSIKKHRKVSGGMAVRPECQFTGSAAWTNWPLFTVGLLMRGFSESAVKNLLRDNFLRVLKQSTE